MPSYQDIETRLMVVEDKIDLVMKSIVLRIQSGLIDKKVEQKSLYDLYLLTKHAGVAAEELSWAAAEAENARSAESSGS